MHVLQRYGDDAQDELAFEAVGDYTRQYGYLNFSDYDVDQKKSGSYLNSVWYQPEEVFPVTGTPEVRQHAFWVQVDQNYYNLSQKLEVTCSLIIQISLICFLIQEFSSITVLQHLKAGVSTRLPVGTRWGFLSFSFCLASFSRSSHKN